MGTINDNFSNYAKIVSKRKSQERLSVQFENFHAVDPAVLDLEAQGGADHMETLDPGCSRIYHQHVAFGITNHFQDMGVAADEYIRMIPVDEFPGA